MSFPCAFTKKHCDHAVDCIIRLSACLVQDRVVEDNNGLLSYQHWDKTMVAGFHMWLAATCNNKHARQHFAKLMDNDPRPILTPREIVKRAVDWANSHTEEQLQVGGAIFDGKFRQAKNDLYDRAT